jgi:plastocyanin
LRDSKEASVRNKLDYSGVVVSLEPISTPAPALKPTRAKMIQRDKTFVPHILPIAAGTTVEFPNYDPIFHNAFSNYDGQTFDVGLYPPGTSRSVRFSRTGVVRIFCNIHAHMSAVIVVLPTQWFSLTAPDGSFEIPNLPPGLYRLRVFHERATDATLASLARDVAISAASEALPALTISESGYLPVPHKNKFGQEYPPAPADEGFYPSVRK